MFTHIKRSNNGLLVRNLVLLFGVTAVPYPTAVLAAHLGQPGQRTATLLFNGTFIFIAIFFNLLWRYASSPHRHLLAHDVDADAVARITRMYSFGPLPYLICFALAWVSVPVSLAANAAMGGFFALPPTVIRPKM